MFKTLIIDDEPKSISSIRLVLEKNCSHINLVGTAQSVDEAYEKMISHTPDIIFLDVEMPYGNGFELLNKIFEFEFEIIFVTAYENFAIRAFKVNAADYILKPFTEDDIINAVKKATDRVQEKKLLKDAPKIAETKTSKNMSKRLAVPTFDGLAFLNIDQIIRCEASENYTTFYLTNKKKLLVCKSLSDYEELLNPLDFHRIHQSHLINIEYVQKYVRGRGGYVVMEDGAMVDVSARKKVEFLENIFK